MVVASIVGGLIFAFGAIADTNRDLGKDESRTDEEHETEVGNRLEAQLAAPMTQVQLVVLSFLATAVGGAVTALMADAAPLKNALVVGVVSFLGAFLPAGPIPRRTLLIAGVVSIPCALLGAMLVT